MLGWDAQKSFRKNSDSPRESKEIEEIVIAGSYRRCKETVGDLDILVTATQPKPVVECFTRYD